jgi:hypothetical protein
MPNGSVRIHGRFRLEMGERIFVAIVLLLGVGAGAFLQRLLPPVKDLLKDLLRRTENEEKEQATVEVPRHFSLTISEWLQTGRNRGILNAVSLEIEATDQGKLYEWLCESPSTQVAYVEQVSEAERKRLWKWFWVILGYLALTGALSGWWVFSETAKGSPHLARIAVAAGIFGSCIAAFRSCLDRRAKGFEDKYGNVAPGLEKKERFSDGMVVWLLGRPLLGGAVGLLVYIGLNGEIFSVAVKEKILAKPWEFLFYMILVGLFAKAILDLLRKLTKEVFHV